MVGGAVRVATSLAVSSLVAVLDHDRTTTLVEQVGPHGQVAADRKAAVELD